MCVKWYFWVYAPHQQMLQFVGFWMERRSTSWKLEHQVTWRKLCNDNFFFFGKKLHKSFYIIKWMFAKKKEENKCFLIVKLWSNIFLHNFTSKERLSPATCSSVRPYSDYIEKKKNTTNRKSAKWEKFIRNRAGKSFHSLFFFQRNNTQHINYIAERRKCDERKFSLHNNSTRVAIGNFNSIGS
jgi:hypothetical protein